MTKTSSGRIGRIGQRIVCNLADGPGSTPQAAENDERGWDVLIQFDVDDDPGGPLDRHVPHRTCWLQVKTTRRKRSSWDIKLSNWARMVNDPSPWFVAVVHLSDSDQATSVHLVHIDEQWSEKALRELRRASAPGSDPANRVKLAVRWSDADLVPNLVASSFLARINEAIGPDYDGYVREKRERNESLGYDEGPDRVTVTFSNLNDRAMEELADVAVGLRRALPRSWKATAHQDVRFGMPRKTVLLDPTSGDMEMAPGAQGDVHLRIESDGPWRPAEMHCQVYVARNIFPFIPERLNKVRIVAPRVSFVRMERPSGGPYLSFSASLPPTEPLPLSEIEAAARAVLHVGHGAGALFRLSAGGRASTFRTPPVALATENLDQFRFFESIAWLCREFGMPDSAAVHLGIAEQNRVHSDFMVQAMREPRKGPLSIAAGFALADGERAGAVGAVSTCVGDMVLLAIYGMHGVVVSSEQHGSLWRTQVSEPAIIWDKFVVPVNLWEDFDLKKALARTGDQLRKLELNHVFMDPLADRKTGSVD